VKGDAWFRISLGICNSAKFAKPSQPKDTRNCKLDGLTCQTRDKCVVDRTWQNSHILTHSTQPNTCAAPHTLRQRVMQHAWMLLDLDTARN
jgi:hypothetical protein